MRGRSYTFPAARDWETHGSNRVSGDAVMALMFFQCLFWWDTGSRKASMIDRTLYRTAVSWAACDSVVDAVGVQK